MTTRTICRLSGTRSVPPAEFADLSNHMARILILYDIGAAELGAQLAAEAENTAAGSEAATEPAGAHEASEVAATAAAPAASVGPVETNQETAQSVEE